MMTEEASLQIRVDDFLRHRLQSRGISTVHHVHDVFFISRISRDALCVYNMLTDALKAAKMTA